MARPAGEIHWMRHHPERIARGENCGHNKLSAAAVDAVRSRVLAGERQCDLASEYGVSRAQVSRIISRKQWK